MRKPKNILLLISGLLLVVGAGAWYITAGNGTIEQTERVGSTRPLEQAGEEQQDDDSYRTVAPRRIGEDQSLTLIGTVVSNEFATVYARRSGIIRDLFVDIGDTVQANQTIGELLPPGDVGQSSANIYEKQVRVQEAKANLEYLQKASQQMIDKVVLDKELQQVDGNTASKQMIEKIKTDIANNQRTLTQLKQKHKEQLQKIVDDLEQEKQQVPVLVASIIQSLEHILLGADHTTAAIAEGDLRRELGIKNTAKRYEALDEYRQLLALYNNGDSASLEYMLEQTYQAIDVFLSMIQYSSTSESLSQTMLEEFTQMLYVKQSNVLDKQEMLEDLQNLYTATKEAQGQEEIMLENMIVQGQAMLSEKTATLQTAEQKAEQQVDLVTAEQELKVQQAKNMVQIAQANLNKEYASSGNEKIVTPFGGTVSKRMVQVGDMVSMGMPLYELIDVPTSLSKKAKREVQFGLPEEYSDLIALGESITFTAAQSAANTYTGVIHRLSPQVDQMTKTITVQALLPDNVELPHNSRVNVSLGMIQEQVYQVPAATIIYAEGETFVPELIGDDEVILLPVAVLADDGEFADVQGALDENTAIVRNYRIGE